jgi:hypothetical protein
MNVLVLKLAWLGLELDPELLIARDTVRIIEGAPRRG